jgi:hypothetical protein
MGLEQLRRVQVLRAIPAGPGHGQLRPVLLGWQFRISVMDRMRAEWGPWMFALGPRRRALARLERLDPIWIEEQVR